MGAPVRKKWIKEIRLPRELEHLEPSRGMPERRAMSPRPGTGSSEIWDEPWRGASFTDFNACESPSAIGCRLPMYRNVNDNGNTRKIFDMNMSCREAGHCASVIAATAAALTTVRATPNA
jgi:hypothetical protein